MSDSARSTSSTHADGDTAARAFAYPFLTGASWRFS